VKTLFCQNCESSNFEKQSGLTMGPPDGFKGHKTTWILLKCKECGLFKLQVQEEEIDSITEE
jgi:hypothetical protein